MLILDLFRSDLKTFSRPIHAFEINNYCFLGKCKELWIEVFWVYCHIMCLIHLFKRHIFNFYFTFYITVKWIFERLLESPELKQNAHKKKIIFQTWLCKGELWCRELFTVVCPVQSQLSDKMKRNRTNQNWICDCCFLQPHWGQRVYCVLFGRCFYIEGDTLFSMIAGSSWSVLLAGTAATVYSCCFLK